MSRRVGYTFDGNTGTTLTDAVLAFLGLATERQRGQRIESPAGPNPAFVEELMGFPRNWTDVDFPRLETPSSRNARKRSGA